MKFTNLKPIIKDYLIKYPRMRDSDPLLLSAVLVQGVKAIIPGVDFNKMSAYQLIQLIGEGQLPNTESIRRCRQLLQQHNPELRGKSYDKRKTVLEEESRKDIILNK